MPTGAPWIWIAVALHAAWLGWVSRTTRWVVVGVACALWVYVTYYMPFMPPDDKLPIALGLFLLGMMIGGVVAELVMSFRQLLARGKDG